MDAPFDPADEDVREELAAAAYYRERGDEAAIDRERHPGPDHQYACLSWENLSDHSRRPYRTAVATVCDALLVRA